MKAALRTVAAVIAGFVVASLVMMAFETMNARWLHPGWDALAQSRSEEVVRAASLAPPGEAPDRREMARRLREVMRGVLAEAPARLLLVVAAGWVVGSFAGGFVAASIGRKKPIFWTVVLGGLLTLAGIASNLMMPPPTWFWILTLLAFVPATHAGAVLAARRRAPAVSPD